MSFPSHLMSDVLSFLSSIDEDDLVEKDEDDSFSKS